MIPLPETVVKLCVIICTHNPKPAILAETLEALRAQTLDLVQWEFLLIDNASTNGVPAAVDLGWHPHARRLVEPILGIAPTRHRALSEALKGNCQIILFVDDDTLLAPDYLATGLTLAAADARLGCWGGQLLPRYEVEPPAWFEPFKKYLAIFPLSRDLVAGSFAGDFDYLPPTAGMFLRRELAEHYLPLSTAHPLRLSLGAKGDVLLRGEDTDLALSAYDCGLHTGRFQALRLVHLIPKERVTLAYLERLLEGVYAGARIIGFLRAHGTRPAPGFFSRARQRWQLLRLPARDARLFAAQLRGEQRARAMIAAQKSQSAVR